MKRSYLVLLVLLLIFLAYRVFIRPENSIKKEEKQAAISLKSHSEIFNDKVQKAVNAYFSLKDALAEDDSINIKAKTSSLINLLDSIPMEELKKDTASIYEGGVATLNDIKSNFKSLLQQTTMETMRQDFSMATDMMYPGFFKMINYEGATLYLQYCPMAFGDEKGANWISNSAEIVNPYLGKNHPIYKAAMLHCGELKDSLVRK